MKAKLEAAEKETQIMGDERRELKNHVVEIRVMKEALREEMGKMKELHQLKMHELSEDYNMRLIAAENESIHSKERAKVVQERALGLLQ